MKFNPVPTDAPQFYTNKAHFLGEQENVQSYRKHQESKSRFYSFSIGRSERSFLFKDQLLDDLACSFLNHAKKQKARLILKGYLSPVQKGHTFFAVLTHIAIYHKRRLGAGLPINPQTGEIGFYTLSPSN